MTTTFGKKRKCDVCGQASYWVELFCMTNYGPPDLYGRPPLEIIPSTIDTRLQTCPGCGYCAPRISDANKRASELVISKTYRQTLSDANLPKLANAFNCYSWLRQQAGDYVAAGSASIHAAWICDDEAALKGAQMCRRKAAKMLEIAKENDPAQFDDIDEIDLLIVDLLRRSHQFTAALKKCEEGLTNFAKETWTLKSLSAEKNYILKHDTESNLVPTPSDNVGPYPDKNIFDCLDMIARLEHKSKNETRHLLFQTAIKRYIDKKAKTNKSIKDIFKQRSSIAFHEQECNSIKLIALLENKRKSAVSESLIEEGIKSYAKQFKSAALGKGINSKSIDDIVNFLVKNISNHL
jgi:hypothetical protein